MFLPAIICFICIIYIYFYVLRRFFICGLRYDLSVNRKIKTVWRVVLRCMREALWGFVKIIGITVPTLHQIAAIYQLYKLVAECGLRHSNRLPYGSGRKCKHKSVCIRCKV